MNATIQIKFTNLMSSEINKPYKCLISNKKTVQVEWRIQFNFRNKGRVIEKLYERMLFKKLAITFAFSFLITMLVVM